MDGFAMNFSRCFGHILFFKSVNPACNFAHATLF